MPNIEIVRGQTLTLECVTEGWPVPSIKWVRNEGSLPKGRFFQRLGGSLELFRVAFLLFLVQDYQRKLIHTPTVISFEIIRVVTSANRSQMCSM